jgi:hypothetical protein
MPSWTLVRHCVSQCLRTGGAPIDTPWGTDRRRGQRIMDAGLMKEEMPLFTTPVRPREKAMFAIITAMYVGDNGITCYSMCRYKGLGDSSTTSGIWTNFFEVRIMASGYGSPTRAGRRSPLTPARHTTPASPHQRKWRRRLPITGRQPDVESFRIRRCVLESPEHRKPPTRIDPKQPRVHRSPM